jgi:serine/threonine protein kinase
MPLGPGSELAHDSILGPLGAGAMGEVYRARDSKLEREVAIKVLPEHFADDEERLKRFEREAKKPTTRTWRRSSASTRWATRASSCLARVLRARG